MLSENTTLIENSVLPYLLRLPEGSGDKPVPALIMMHGRGANEGDIYELVPFVDRRVLVAAPRAPLLNSDDPRGSFKWFDISAPGVAEPGTFDASVAKMVSFIEQLEQSTGVAIDRAQVYVGGFSQGAAMSLGLVAARPDLIAGVIAHSGPFSSQIETRVRAAKLAGKPFFVAHGTRDAILPLDHANRMITTLRELGADVTYHEYDFDHETSVQSRQDLADWLNPRLKF